jgi:hypothetical protein
MNGMKIGKQIEVETLNLKFLTETLEIAEAHLKDGTDDLHFRLSHFRKRVTEKDKDKFDQYFFGAKMTDMQNSHEGSSDVVLHQETALLPKVYKKKDMWLKKIYRKIVSSTHPDKFTNFPVANLKEKYLKIYRKTVSAWDLGKDDLILLSAYETDIRVDNPKALPILKQGNKQKSIRLQEIKKLLAYQWYHIPEKDRSKTLEVYLEKLGYEFTPEEIEKVVNIARKRKVGKRPKNLRKLKNVK